MTDNNVEIAQLQKSITEHIGYGSDNLVFDYNDSEVGTKMDVITINPRHNQSFLFASVEGFNKIDALRKMVDYVKDYKNAENSYTIQWTLKSDSELHTSYFRASHILEAIDKLHFGRDLHAITIFSVVMNPIS